MIHSIPYLTNAYLIPNIKTFKAQYPDLKITIESKVTRARLNEPHRHELQVGLRHGKGDDEAYIYDEISPVQMTPICAPGYDLNQTLTQINLTTDNFSWAQWESEWKTSFDFKDTMSCDGMYAVVDMVEQGLGIAMGYLPFVTPKVSQGELTLVYPDMISDLDGLYLAYPKAEADNPIIIALSAWLKDTIVKRHHSVLDS